MEVVPVRPANAGEAPHLTHLFKGCKAVRVPADKACSSETNRAVLARYITREKVKAEQTFEAVAMNLLKAANRIDLVAA